jgi:hypothetical protein
MMVEFIYSFHGSLVYFDEANDLLRHGAGPAVPRNAGLVSDGDQSWWVCLIDGEWQRLDGLSGSGHIRGEPGAAPLLLHNRRLADGLLTLEARGLLVCAEANGTLTLSRQVQGVWETFAPVSEQELDFLDEIRGRSWIASGGGGVISGPEGIRLTAQFRAIVGEHNVPLRTLLGARHRQHADGWSMVYEGWKVERFTAFQPLVYLLAYGDAEDLACLGLALRALVEFGRYTGDIVIFSDRPPDQLQQVVPRGMERQITVVDAAAHDQLDVAAMKYLICDMPEFVSYRPLLYLGADVICNRPLDSILPALLQANRVCVPLGLERLDQPDVYGNHLFAADVPERPRNGRGFSTNVIGIPDLPVARRSFPVIVDSLYGLARSQGTRELGSRADQPVANYVLHKTDDVDFEFMTELVATPGSAEQPLSEIPRIGFTHFVEWEDAPNQKLSLMRAYLDLLRNSL